MVLGDLFDFYLIIRLSLCLFNYSGNIDVYNGNISNFLSIYLMFLLPLLLLLLHHHWQKFQLDAHSCVLAEENYMFDHLPRSTLMNAISIGLYIVRSVLIENTTILSHLFSNQANELEKNEARFSLAIVILFVICYCYFAEVMIGTYCAFLKFTRQGWSKVIINFVL